jgi:hypothetical protein
MHTLFVNSCHLQDRDELEKTNNIILPSSILEDLPEFKFQIYFKITNIEMMISTYTSVQEFTGPENIVIMPLWLMEYLCVDEMSVIKLEHFTNIKSGKFIRLVPQEKEFFKVEDNDKELEKSLSKFSVLHENLTFRCDINGNPMSFLVKDIEGEYADETNENSLASDHVIAISNRDINLDIENKFPPTPPPTPEPVTKPQEEPTEFAAFSGKPQTIGGDKFDRRKWLERLESACKIDSPTKEESQS